MSLMQHVLLIRVMRNQYKDCLIKYIQKTKHKTQGILLGVEQVKLVE